MIISADRLIVGDRKTVIEDGAVYIVDGVIEMVGKRCDVEKKYPDEPIEHFPGSSIMPGMIDLHVHLGWAQDPSYIGKYNSASLCTLYAAGKMSETLKEGVTTIRDVSSSYGLGTALKKASADGHIRAPRIFTSLQGICMTGGHGADPNSESVLEVDGVDAIRKAIRVNLKNGADCIKVLTSEGYRGQELSQEELNAAAEESHRFGLKIAAHAGYGDSIQMCIDAGFDSIEHGTHLTKEQAIQMKEQNITWVPTVLVFNYLYNQLIEKPEAVTDEMLKGQVKYLKESVEIYQKNLKQLYDTGLRIATGTDTDCIQFEGASPVSLECAYLVKCGLKPLEAIECATKNGADYLGIKNLGQIKESYIADIIVVDGNPLEHIEALTRVSAVYQDGKRVN
ncbi:amidohydrolase family protein [Fusibacter ferrireducens]|uniref:Amidohydrolase family protein n=1 Tax=Fusibacter ferrireducens TaxID=2785058 RepID=A0ABR9ZPF0_9FIRM|nr:amidohydrolase family protein [Fusibacter ferrireducens]MBF4692335.1 amidohydrolase family protein [Fusibacter ferrireducens]